MKNSVERLFRDRDPEVKVANEDFEIAKWKTNIIVNSKKNLEIKIVISIQIKHDGT